LEFCRADDRFDIHLEDDGSPHMYTLMKSEKMEYQSGATGSRAYEQVEVGQYVHFLDAVAACDKANREHADWHYLMNDSGKELYNGSWID
jgi:hypothetical protein